MTDWIAKVDYGDKSRPGEQYTERIAAIKRAKNGQFELNVISVWGSNQGYLQEEGRIERRYRAENLDELLRIGISEIRDDDDFSGNSGPFVAAIREAIFDAQDTEAGDESDTD